MTISFDLDDTLIPSRASDFPTVRRNLFQVIMGIELIRSGTKMTLVQLRKAGHHIGIYTTSYRSKFKIRFQLLTYGIKVDFVINEWSNRKKLKKNNIASSKYPPAFGIDIHIDDSEGVLIESKRLGFNTIVIEKNDLNWSDKIEHFIKIH